MSARWCTRHRHVDFVADVRELVRAASAALGGPDPRPFLDWAREPLFGPAF
jgi:hypothetical protein